jgi:hypothetical protein
MEFLFYYIFSFILIVYVWSFISPKLDWNFETKERLLWYNDPFDHFTRKFIVLYKKKD